MNNIHRINEVMEYIESKMTDQIDMNQVAKIALCSEFHFSKMFSYLAGVSLSEYIRNRRLTLAVSDLSASSLTIVDIATKYGYSSADAFTRAFKKMHGVLPSEVRAGSEIVKSYPKLSFEIKTTGAKEMEYRIIEKEEFNLIGFMENVTIKYSGENEQITEMYKNFNPEVIAELKAMSNIEPKGIMSASLNFVDRHIDGVGTMDHVIGVASTESSDKFQVVPVEKGTWAVFISEGPFPETLQQTWSDIYGQWFPSTNFVPTGGVEITRHESVDMSDPNYRSEIWIPVKLLDSKN